MRRPWARKPRPVVVADAVSASDSLTRPVTSHAVDSTAADSGTDSPPVPVDAEVIIDCREGRYGVIRSNHPPTVWVPFQKWERPELSREIR